MADDTQVINLKIKVGAEGVQSVDLVDGKLGHLEGTAGKTGATMDRVTDSFKRMLVAAGAGYTISALTGQFTEYRQELANVQSVAGANADEMERLAAASRAYGIDFATGAQKATAAQYALGSAGQTTNEIIDSQQAVMALGAAAGRDMAASSALITSTLSQFNLEAAKSAEVADIYASAIAGSQANLDRLAISMRYVGPVAANVGQDLRLTTAELMALYNAGFEASQAGTALRSTFSTLLNPTKEQAEALTSLGVSATDAQGQLKAFPTILDEFKAAGAGAAEIMAIFGQEAGPAMIALVSQGGAAIRQYEAQLYQSGAAAEMAKIQLDHLGGDLKRLRAVSEDAAIGFVGYLEPALRAGAQGAIWLIQHGEILVGTLGTAGAAMAVFKAETFLMNDGVVNAGKAVSKLWGTLLNHPFALAVAGAGAVLTALAGVAGALETSEEHWRALHQGVTEAGQAHKEAARKLDEAQKALSDLETGLEEAAGDQAKEKEVVEQLNALYPDLAANYDGSKESLIQLKGVLAEYVELRRQEEQIKSAEEQREFQALIKETTYQVAELRGEWTATAKELGANPEAEAELAGLSRQAEALWEQYQKLGESKKDFPGLAGSINEAQSQIVALLELMVQTSWQAADAPAQVLARIQAVIEATRAAKAAAEEPPSTEALLAAYDAAVQAANKRGEAAVKAVDKEQAAHEKVADEIARLTQEEYDFKIGQLERWKLRLEAQGKWTEDQQRLYAARRMAIEKDHTEKLAKEEKKRTDKAAAEAKRKAAEHKKYLDKQAKEENSYTKLMETISDKTLSDKQRALAQLEREYRAYYEKLEELSKTDYERYLKYESDKTAIAAAYNADRTKLLKQYAKEELSAFDQVMVQWADGHKQMAQVTADTFTDIRRTAGDILFDALTKGFKDVGDAWEAVTDNMVNVFAQAIAEMLVIWGTTNIGRLFTGGDYFPFFGSLGGGGSGGAAGSIGSSVASSLLKKGMGAIAEKLGIPTDLESLGELLGLTGGGAALPSGAGAYLGTGESLGMFSGMDASSITALGEEIAAGFSASGGAMGGGAGGAMAEGLADLGINLGTTAAASATAAALASGSSAYLGGMYASMSAAELAALAEGAAAMAGVGTGAAAGGAAASSGAAAAGAGATMAGAGAVMIPLLIAMAMGAPDPFTAMTTESSHTRASALRYTGHDMSYLQRREASEAGLSLRDLAGGSMSGEAGLNIGTRLGAAVEIERIADRAGLSQEQIDNMLLGVDDLMLKYEELSESAQAAAEAGNTELAASLQKEAEATAQAAAETQMLADALGFSADGLSAQGVAMYEAAQAQAALDKATQGIVTGYQDWDGSAEKIRAQVNDLVSILETAGVNTDGMASSTADLINQMLEGTITLDQFAASLNDTFLNALESAAKGGDLTAEQFKTLTDVLTGALDPSALTDADYAADYGEAIGAAIVGGINQEFNAGDLSDLVAYGITEDADQTINDVRVYASTLGTTLAEGVGEGAESIGELSNLLASDLTNGMGASAEAVENLRALMLQLGEVTGKGEKGFAGTAGFAIDELSKEDGLIKHLLETGNQAEGSAGMVRNLAEWIAALQDKEIDVIANVYRREQSTDTKGVSHSMASFHTGGHVGYDYAELRHFHTGGLVGALASDEIPAIVKVDEFLVRSERVTPATLPILEGINRGETPRLGGDVYVSVNLNGDVIGEAGTIERVGRGVGEAVIIALDEREAAGEVPGAPRRLEVRI